MAVNMKNHIVKFVMQMVQHYNHEKYWKRRREVINPDSKIPYILRLYWLYFIKKSDAYNNASMGTNIGSGAIFETPPQLPHHLNGIIIGHNVIIGKNVRILQQVTVAEGFEGKPTIVGDNCLLGKGCLIQPGVKLGNDVRVGANSVVICDIPDGCIVSGVPAKIIKNYRIEEK